MKKAARAEVAARSTTGRSEPAYLKIYGTLREHLTRNALEPGLVLGQANVARVFNVSRIPAGIALARLASEGLIQAFDGRGYLVPGAPALRKDLAEAGLAIPLLLASPAPNRRDQIYREVEHAVAMCVAYGRFLLNETALAQQYDVSRTIAHEVLTQLERSGIIEQDTNRRWYAGPLAADVFRHHYEMRRLLEPEALRQAFPLLDMAEIRKRRSELEGLGRYPQETERLEQVEADLHLDTLAPCPNRVLLSAVRRSQRVLIASHTTFANLRTEAEISAMLHEHAQVYDGLLSGSVETAVEKLSQHLRRALDPNLKILQRLPALPPHEVPRFLVMAR